jgi:hypothetical protein
MASALQLNGVDNSITLAIPSPASGTNPETNYSIEWKIALDGDGTTVNDRAIPLGANSDPSIDTTIIHSQSNNEIIYNTRLANGFLFSGITGVTWTDYNEYEIVVNIAAGAAKTAELFVNGASKGTSAANPNPIPYAFDRAGQTNQIFRTGRLQYVAMTDNITSSNSRFYDVRGITAGSSTTTIPETTGNGTSGTVTGTPNYVSDAADTIVITTQDYRIWQRNGSEEASVTITGTYTGTPTTIEKSIDGGAWATAIASPSSNAFSDTFTLATGQYSVAYRFSNATSVNDTVTYISVGDIFVGAGQSNISGRGTSNQTYTASAGGVLACLLGNDDNYKALSDPSDSATNQVDRISDDLLESPGLAQPTGSWILRFVNAWLANSEVPIGYLPCPLGATSASQWAKTSSDRISALNLYESMARRLTAIGGIKAVFYEQGEQDSVSTTNSQYQTLLNAFVDDVNTDFGVSTYIVPLHTITASGYDGNGSTTGQAAIRAAQVSVAASNSNAIITQPLTDIDLSSGDGLHFKTDTELNTVGLRVYQSYAGLVSTLNITVAGTPDGTYKTIITNPTDDGVVFSGDLVYASASATTGVVSVVVGTDLTGFVIDNEATHVNGAVITGTTV